MGWFYMKGSDTLGPWSDNDIYTLLTSGEIGPETLIWREGLAWGRLADRPELEWLIPMDRRVFRKIPTDPDGLKDYLRAEINKPRVEPNYFGAEDEEGWSNPPAPIGTPIAPGAVPERSALRHAGPWSRLVARIVDLMVLSATLLAGWAALQAIETTLPARAFMLLNVALPLAIVVAFVVLCGQFGSLGKTMVGIKVMPLHGRTPLPFQIAVRREIELYGHILGLWPPSGSIANALRAFARVRAGEATAYDARRFVIIETSDNIRGRMPSALLLAGVYLLFAIKLMILYENPDPALALPLFESAAP